MPTSNFELRKQFYETPEWMELRERILLRDGARCRNCGHPERLEVHHWLPEHRFAADHDSVGYGPGVNPLLVNETGLITLCDSCHEALTNIRRDRGLERDPRQKNTKHNIFQLWALAGEVVPFRAVKESWSGKPGQYMLVERVEIKTWPYGSAWGRYSDGTGTGDLTKIANAGTFTWAFYDASGETV